MSDTDKNAVSQIKRTVPLENPERLEVTRFILVLSFLFFDAYFSGRSSRHLAFAHPFTC